MHELARKMEGPRGRVPPPGPYLGALTGSTGANVVGLRKGARITYRMSVSDTPSRARSLCWDRHADTNEA
jgi:hypothetical protein